MNRLSKHHITIIKLKEAWERGELTISFSGNCEFLHQPELDDITHKLVTMDWVIEPEFDDVKEEYMRILQSIPRDTYEDLIMGKWVQPEDEE